MKSNPTTLSVSQRIRDIPGWINPHTTPELACSQLLQNEKPVEIIEAPFLYPVSGFYLFRRFVPVLLVI